MQRRAPFRSSLGEQEGAVRKVKRRQARLTGNERVRRQPSEPARDHQVNDHERLIVHRPDDPLAKTRYIANGPTLDVLNRRANGSKQKWAGKTDALERPTDDAGAKRVEVQLDVRELRHCTS